MKDRKKILYLITKSEPFGGAQRYVFDLATNVPKEQFDVSVAFGGSGTLKEKLQNKNIRTIHIESLVRDINLSKEIKVFFELVKLFREEKPDIVHINSSKAGGLGALAARIARVERIVFTSHGLVFEEPRSAWVCYVLRFFTWLTFIFCHEVIVISKNNLRTARSFAGVKNKLHHIYNGIAKPKFLGRNNARNELGAMLSNKKISDNTIVVGVIAELTTNKGHLHLVRAYKRILGKNPSVICLFFGGGELEQEIKEEVNGLGLTKHIFFLGYVPNAAKYLKGLDIFLLPSLKEGHPYTLLEAGFASLPVVGTNIPGVTDIITDMKSGILVRSKDEKELSQACVYMLDHPEQSKDFGGCLYEKVEKEFGLKKMIKKTINLYKET